MELQPLTDQDRHLIEVAQQVLRDNYVPGRHTCAAAVLCPGERIYTGISIQTCGFGTCAEPVALGAAFTNGERKALSLTVVCRRFNDYAVIPPCGNCRQLLLDYIPDVLVILDDHGSIGKTAARHLLPGITIVDEHF